MILLNLPYFTMSGDAYGPTFVERDLLLPEKIFDTKNKKYLTIRQMLEYEMTYPEYILLNTMLIMVLYLKKIPKT